MQRGLMIALPVHHSRGVKTAMLTVPELSFLSISEPLLLLDSSQLPTAGLEAAALAARRRRHRSTPPTVPPITATAATATIAHTQPGVPLPLPSSHMPASHSSMAEAGPPLIQQVTLTSRVSTATSPTAGRGTGAEQRRSSKREHPCASLMLQRPRQHD